MAGVFPRTQKNSNLKALVENALLPFAHLRLNQQILSDGQDNISPRRFNQPSYEFQSIKFHAQPCGEKLLSTESLTGNKRLPEDSFFEIFKSGLKNKTLQICKYRLRMWTEDQIQRVKQTYQNSKGNILENIRDSPFYIEIEDAEIYNQTDNTLFGNPQSIQMIHLVSHLMGGGAGRLVKSMYMLQQDKPIQSHIVASGVVDKADISTTQDRTLEPRTDNSDTASINDKQTTVTLGDLCKTRDATDDVRFIPKSDTSGDEEDYSDNIDDGNAIPVINASVEGGSSPSREISEENGKGANLSGNDTGHSTKKKHNDESVNVDHDCSDINVDGTSTSNSGAFAATQQSQVYDEEDEIEREEDMTYKKTAATQEEIFIPVMGDYEGLRSLIQDYLNHAALPRTAQIHPGDKDNLQRSQEYLEERLQRRLTAEEIQYVDNVLKGSTDQESNFITSPNEVVGDSETDHSDAGSSRFDSINTAGDFTFEEEAKDSKSIAIEPANDEIEREEKEDKTIYEITIPVDADKLGMQVLISKQSVTIIKIYPNSFARHSGLVEVGDYILEVEVNGKYRKNVTDYISNITKLKRPCKLKLQRWKKSPKEDSEKTSSLADTGSTPGHDSYMNEFSAEENKDITQIHDDDSQYQTGEIELEELGDAVHSHQKQFTQQSQVGFLEEDESIVHTRKCDGKNLVEGEEEEDDDDFKARNRNYENRIAKFLFEDGKWHTVKIARFKESKGVHECIYLHDKSRQDLFIDRCIELGKLEFLDGTDSNSTTGSHSQDKERIAENETADRNNSVASEDMGKACDAGFEHKIAGPTRVNVITVASEALGQGDAMTKKQTSVGHVEEDTQVTGNIEKDLIKSTANKQSCTFIGNFPEAFWKTIEEKIQVLLEKYHTFERPLTIKGIVRTLSRSLNMIFTTTQQSRIDSIYAALLKEKKKLLPRIAFLNKFENDDDNFFYHIFRGAIWYIPVKGVAFLSWNESWEDVTNHSIFTTEKFLQFRENYDKKIKRRSGKRKRSRTTNVTSPNNYETRKYKNRRSVRGNTTPKFVNADQVVPAPANDTHGINLSGSMQEHEIVFPEGINTLGFSVDTVRINGKNMLAVSSIQEFGYANCSADLAVGDLLVHVRTMTNEFNLEKEDDIEKMKVFVATKERPVSFTIRRRKPEHIDKDRDVIISVKQEVNPASTPRAWVGHQALL